MFALVKTVKNNLTDEDVQSIKLFAPYTLWEDKNGTQYSPDYLTSLTSSQKQDLGIYAVAYGTRLNDRFYTVTENAPTFDSDEKIVKVTFTSVPKELEDEDESKGLKSECLAQIKDTSNKFLSRTDWMLVRKIERDVDVPTSTTTYRAAVVTEANRLKTAINASTNVEQLITAVESANWPTAE